MSSYTVYAKHFLSDNGWKDNCVIEITDGVINSIKDGEDGDFFVEYLSLGLIDNHIHGGNGFTINNINEQDLEKWLNLLACSGICAILPAVYGTVEEIRNTLKTIKSVMQKQEQGEIGGALILGVHLEGSFINPENPGSFEAKDILTPSIDVFKSIANGYEGVIKEITIAPEKHEAEKLINYLKGNGVKMLAGHTLCDYNLALDSFKKGIGAVCHTFNCTPPIHHRNVSILNAALTEDDIYCEMIGDLKHLHPSTVKLLIRAKQGTRIMLISDAIKIANLPDGIYEDGGVMIEVSDGFAKVQGTDTVAGANCYISKSVKNLVDIGIPFEIALNSAGKNVATWLELKEYGANIGQKAIFTAWNKDIEPAFTVIKDKIYMTDNN